MINRAVVFAALAAFITAVYIAVVVGLGALVGAAGDPPLALSILATAIVAVAFQPVRVRVQRLANRLVYGRRASPYEALAAISEQAAAARAAEDVLPRVARAVAEGTGAAHAHVWVASAGELRLTAAWPDGPAGSARTVTLDDADLPHLPDVDAAVPVRYRGELLGALSVVKPRGEALSAADEQLLGDVASQAGLVLRNVRLTAELLARLEDLRASRQRLVSAQDEQRRRLERNLHDGAQQHLVALRSSSRSRATGRSDSSVQQALAGLQHDVDEAIEALRDLARGIYPPLLAHQGLAAALEAHARKAAFPLAIEAEGVGRYPQDVEAAVYFCCLEALQNVAKYASASRAEVRLDEADGELASRARRRRGLRSRTTARGSGLQDMADRPAALGGQVDVISTPAGGTVVTGSIPVLEANSAARGRSAMRDEQDGGVPGTREPELREAGAR